MRPKRCTSTRKPQSPTAERALRKILGKQDGATQAKQSDWHYRCDLGIMASKYVVHDVTATVNGTDAQRTCTIKNTSNFCWTPGSTAFIFSFPSELTCVTLHHTNQLATMESCPQ